MTYFASYTEIYFEGFHKKDTIYKVRQLNRRGEETLKTAKNKN